ncbi:MAG TPA: alpha/beta fold hydrolase [Candidatus Acidoferrum sp.]|nr:alpha/beta fold hydrolase [Candidatus Acidoferrum sp.]
MTFSTKQIVFEPHALLKNGHAMTIAAAFVPRKFKLPPAEDRLFQVDPDSRILGRCHWQPGRWRDSPVIVILHGLEGSSESNYVCGIAEKAFRHGFHAVRLNQRNCGGTEALTPTLYNSGMSGDYRAVLEELSNGDGFEQVFFAGYSMGGNLVTKMAGEFGDAVPKALRAVCAVCPAMDLGACADALQLRANFFYQRHFVKGLMARYARKAKLFPERYSKDGFGAVRSVREFDDKITAPQFGYRNAQDYYDAVGAKKVVEQVRVPILMITAQDDPFVPFELFVRADPAKNPAIRFVTPEHGGHCGFISNRPGAERFWAEQRIVEFCSAIRAA